jgi:hypothetical protein
MCTDLASEVARLAGKGVGCSAVKEERWGSVTRLQLPSGSGIGLYQPKHPIAIGLGPE